VPHVTLSVSSKFGKVSKEAPQVERKKYIFAAKQASTTSMSSVATD
jgi:hypothetical protein